MEVALRTLFVGLNPEVTGQKQRVSFPTRGSQKTRLFDNMRNVDQEHRRSRNFYVACAASTALEAQHAYKSDFKDFTVSPHSQHERDIKVRIDASGAKTQAIFDDVFSKLVEAAQPIPGFRRVKGGKIPDEYTRIEFDDVPESRIPKDVLLHILGPSKVIRQTIKKIINSTMAEYVQKEGLRVTKDLRVHQSYEELEEKFVPGEAFGFDATIQLQEIK